MSPKVEIRSADFMDSQTETESLKARIREVEDENQELRAQNLLQNRTIIELRNELVLLRVQMTELADTSALLRERIRNLAQNVQQGQQRENEENVGPLTAPPLMAPPPTPPPLPPARIRISPRQVGAGEALTTPLGISLSAPPRHRIKRDIRQGFYRSNRVSSRRFDAPEPGPSSQTPLYAADRPNYFVGLKIIPQFQTSFVCSPSLSSGYSDTASDSSGSDENPQLSRKSKSRSSGGELPFKRPATKDFDFLKNVRDLHHQKVRQTILQNYNLSLPNTNSKFFFPLPWDRKNRESSTLPSTSGSQFRFIATPNPSTSEQVQGTDDNLRNVAKVSDCVQYTFPKIHEGLNQTGVHSVVTNTGQPSRLRKFKKNIPYSSPVCGIILDEKKTEKDISRMTELITEKKEKSSELTDMGCGAQTSAEEPPSRTPLAMIQQELPSDLEQDGFQADESSNCMTSTDNSLEQICTSESSLEKKK